MKFVLFVLRDKRCVVRRFLALLLWSLIVGTAGSAAASETKHLLTDITILSFENGVTEIKNLDGLGHAGLVVSGFHSTGTAGSYNRVMILMKSGVSTRWDVVIVDTQNKAIGTVGEVDTIRDQPHTVEDQVASIRLAKGKVDGHFATLLIEAWRDTAKAETLASATPVVFEIFVLQPASEGGYAPTFKRLEVARSRKLYCNSDLALAKELALPLPEPFEGPNQDDGCVK